MGHLHRGSLVKRKEGETWIHSCVYFEPRGSLLRHLRRAMPFPLSLYLSSLVPSRFLLPALVRRLVRKWAAKYTAGNVRPGTPFSTSPREVKSPEWKSWAERFSRTRVWLSVHRVEKSRGNNGSWGENEFNYETACNCLSRILAVVAVAYLCKRGSKFCATWQL